MPKMSHGLPICCIRENAAKSPAKWAYSPMVRPWGGGDDGGMTTHTGTPALMSAVSLAELRFEVDRLRQQTGDQVAQELREARPYGGGSNNDEYHAVREQQMVLEARLAALEDVIDRAVVVDPEKTTRDTAAIGSTVTIADLDSGLTSHYRVCSAHHVVRPDDISAASPMGLALIGARPGAVVTVDLPHGRSRRARLVAVEAPPHATRGA
jgi:transcription elongation factor GreA